MDQTGIAEWEETLKRKHHTRNEKYMKRLEELNAGSVLDSHATPTLLYEAAIKNLDEAIDHWVRICAESLERSRRLDIEEWTETQKEAFSKFLWKEEGQINREVTDLAKFWAKREDGEFEEGDLVVEKIKLKAHCELQEKRVASRIESLKALHKRRDRKARSERRHRIITYLLSSAGVFISVVSGVLSYQKSKREMEPLKQEMAKYREELAQAKNNTEREIGKLDQKLNAFNSVRTKAKQIPPRASQRGG